MSAPESFDERRRREAEARYRIMALPEFTLLRIGWEVEPGRVQGGIFYRIGDGLGPTSRDRTTRDVLQREVMGSRLPWPDQRWGIEVLAQPAVSVLGRYT